MYFIVFISKVIIVVVIRKFSLDMFFNLLFIENNFKG